eukprot:TRINITY_DN16003_c0_g1_i1.p1 TRINITY_DN16003_c0_g1~~TRINITY_DN16003_c0_g1_i1.p1  ORF type:complete len:424 (-),score=157.84 TRINITY_DN16003_c0_g1_i1:158-1429(-)
MAEPAHKKRKQSSGAPASEAAQSVASLFSSSGKSSGLAGAFNNLFSGGSAPPAVASTGGVTSGGSSGSKAPATAAPKGQKKEEGQKKESAAKAAAAFAAKFLAGKDGDEGAADKSSGKTEKGAAGDKNADKKVAAGKKVKGKKLAKLSPGEQREVDSKTLFIGNVPLQWEKDKLVKALRNAVPMDVYDGPFKPMRFRAEPLSDEYKGNSMRKVGSMKKAYAKHSADCKIAYVELESPEQVRAVIQAAQGLKADKDHILRLDGVGKAAQLTNFDRKRSVFVGNLPPNTTEADLRKAFESVGEVDAVRIVRDKYANNACKGFAFARFTERGCVKKALNMWGVEVRGREIRVMRIERPEGEEGPATGKKRARDDDAADPAEKRILQSRSRKLRQRMRKAAEGKNTGVKKKKPTKEKGMSASKKRKT